MDADRVGDLFRFLGGRSIVGRLAVLNGYVTEDQLEAARVEFDAQVRRFL